MTQSRIDDLFDALERLGDEEGTEEQLDKTTDLLRDLLNSIGHQVEDFLDSEDVAELMEDYGKASKEEQE